MLLSGLHGISACHAVCGAHNKLFLTSYLYIYDIRKQIIGYRLSVRRLIRIKRILFLGVRAPVDWLANKMMINSNSAESCLFFSDSDNKSTIDNILLQMPWMTSRRFYIGSQININQSRPDIKKVYKELDWSAFPCFSYPLCAENIINPDHQQKPPVARTWHCSLVFLIGQQNNTSQYKYYCTWNNYTFYKCTSVLNISIT